MTQLIVSLEDASMLSEIKKAICLLKGVASVKVSKRLQINISKTLNSPVKEILTNQNSML